METTEIISNDSEEKNSRRNAILLGGAALAGMLFSRNAKAQSSSTVTDADILNFALNLEYLEAQFYTLATTGLTIDQLGISTESGDGRKRYGEVRPDGALCHASAAAVCQ
jgi:hypothetical protein